MNKNSSFISKFKDRCQLVNKSGLISLGVHTVLKKELPTSKSYFNLEKASESLNKTQFLPFQQEEPLYPAPIRSKKKSSLTLPPLRKAPTKSQVPLSLKSKNLNSSYTDLNPISINGGHTRNRRESSEARLNKSLILKY